MAKRHGGRSLTARLSLVCCAANVLFVACVGTLLDGGASGRDLGRCQSLRLLLRRRPLCDLKGLALGLLLSELLLLKLLRRIPPAERALLVLSTLRRPLRWGLNAGRFPILFENLRRFGRRGSSLGRLAGGWPGHSLVGRPLVIRLAASVPAAAGTRRAAHITATAARAGIAAAAVTMPAAAAVTEDRPPRTAIWGRAILVAMQRGQNSLERSTAAVAVGAGKFSAALITRIAAIGRIADPFVDINITAALATTHAAAETTEQSAVAKDAARFAAATMTRAGRAGVGPAFIAAAVPDDRLGNARQREAARGPAAGAARRAAAAAAKQ